MITDGKKWHYVTVKSLPALLKGISLNHNGDFYCLICFHLYRTEKKLKKHERICNDHDYCFVYFVYCILFCFVYCFIFNKILKCNYGEKLLKVPAIIYADLECLLEKMHLCRNNPEKSYTDKKTKHTLSGY